MILYFKSPIFRHKLNSLEIMEIVGNHGLLSFQISLVKVLVLFTPVSNPGFIVMHPSQIFYSLLGSLKVFNFLKKWLNILKITVITSQGVKFLHPEFMKLDNLPS